LLFKIIWLYPEACCNFNALVKINHVSRNQVYCTYIKFEFCLDVKKGKTLLGFVNKLFSPVRLIFVFDLVLLFAELAQIFKLIQNSCMAKLFHEMDLQGIYFTKK
jgi:hypothetical protein